MLQEKFSQKHSVSRPTIDDVARTAGVSKTTISRFLSGKFDSIAEATRKRIQEVIMELNYRPNQMARGLKKDRSYLVGFVMADITNPYSVGALRGAEDVCRKNGYNLMVCNTNNDPEIERNYIYLLQAHRIDGLLITPTGFNNDTLNELSNDYTSVVLVDRKMPEFQFDVIGSDNYRSTQEAVQFLLDYGYDRIAYFSEPFDHVMTRLERVQAFRDTLHTVNHPSVHDVYSIDLNVEGQLEQKVNQFLSETGHCSRAIFAGNAVMLLKIITTLQNKGVQIPEHVSMIGFDDPEWASLIGTGITTIAQQTHQIGMLAMEQVLKRINGIKEDPQKIQLPTKLMVRGSTPRRK